MVLKTEGAVEYNIRDHSGYITEPHVDPEDRGMDEGACGCLNCRDTRAGFYIDILAQAQTCLLYTSPSPRD